MKINDLPPRLARKIEIDSAGCWIWNGAVDPTGYGRTNWLRGYKDQTMAYVHRVVYHLLVDPSFVVLGGWQSLTIDHLCCVKHCVNPDHLEAVTRGDNIRRHHQRRKAAA